MKIIRQMLPLAVILTAVACVKNEPGDHAEERTITWSPAPLRTSAHTKAGYTDFPTDRSFGASAWYLPSGKKWATDADAAQGHFLNSEIVYDGSVWTARTPQYWPGTGTLSIFAWAPFSVKGLKCGKDGVSITGHTMQATPGYEGTDILVADPMPDQSRGTDNGSIPVVFRHILCSVRFTAKLSSASENRSYTINQIDLSGIYTSADFTNGDWANWGTEATYSYTPSEPMQITTGEQVIFPRTMFIPQHTYQDTRADRPRLTIHYTATDSNSTVSSGQFDLYLYRKSTDLAAWGQGKAVTYCLSINPEDDYIDFDASAGGWQGESGGDINIGIDELSFESTASKAGSTIVEKDEDLQQAPFGVFGYKYESGGMNLSQVFESSSAQRVEYGTHGWSYSPKRKWEAKLYIFRAFWPYDAEINSGSDAMRLAIDYSTARDNHDLMVSFNTRDRANEGIAPVKMEFRHALSAICFKLKFKEGEETDNLKKFYLKGIYPVGTMFYGNEADSFEEGGITWKTNMFDPDGENLLWEGSKPFSATETATVYDGDGLMFIIPQTLSASTDRPSSLNFYTEKAGDALHAYDFPKTTLLPGKVYTYTISLSKSNIQISVDIEDWNTIQSNTDINL